MGTQQLANRPEAFPVRPVAAGVLIVCVALAATAAYSYSTLARLRDDYLDSRGVDLVALIDARTRGRGPGGRADPAVWQSAVEETLATAADTVVFLEVVNGRGEVVGRAGERRADLYLFERDLPTPGRGQRGAQTPEGWRVRAGLDPSTTRFITRAATLQAAVALLAIAALAATAAYLVRTARRFVALQEQGAQARRLADLGRMAATLAHEIRNPLGAVKGLTQVARERISADHVAQTHLGTVVDETERLERLVDDLLSFARPRQPELARFDLLDAVRQACDALRSGHPDRLIDLSIEATVEGAPLPLRSDPDGVRQILLNVLLNALQAAPDDGRIRVHVGERDHDGGIEIVVDDNGPGLQGRAPEDLFSPFSTSKARGSGLGLAVSRQIVEQLDGTIELEDRTEGGARCTIVLPKDRPE